MGEGDGIWDLVTMESSRTLPYNSKFEKIAGMYVCVLVCGGVRGEGRRVGGGVFVLMSVHSLLQDVAAVLLCGSPLAHTHPLTPGGC